MRWIVSFCLALIPVYPLYGQKSARDIPLPTQFEIGRHTFFDFGPPFDYYEIILVRPAETGSALTKILVTPPGASCFASAKIEKSSSVIKVSVAELLGSSNPCSIPEKELRRELKRCKKCVVFSGVNVTMRAQCGTETRIIRADILDRDLFGKDTKTPKHTSWTMKLLDRLDQSLGPGVMERPAFDVGDTGVPAKSELNREIEQELASGAYDGLFPRTEHEPQPSALYRSSLVRPPEPTVRLLNSTPFEPLDPPLPAYPSLARATGTQGIVSFILQLDSEGNPTTALITSGHPLLANAAKESVEHWKFPSSAAGQSIFVSLQFKLNCPAKAE